jgi:hypothetical protein
MFLIVSVVFLAIGIKIIIADKKSKKGVLQGIGVIGFCYSRSSRR